MPNFISRNKGFIRFWVAQLVSQFGDRVNQMALVGLVALKHPGSPVELAKLLTFTIIPVFIVGPIAGVYVDRWDRRVTLFVCDFIRGLIVLCIALILINYPSMLPVYGAVFLVFCLSRFYVPAKMSFIPDIVHEGDLHVANSLVSVTGMIAFVMGALLGGLLVEWHGPKGGFLWDAASFFVSGLMVFSITRLKSVQISKEKVIHTSKEMLSIHRSVFNEVKDGVKYIIEKKEILFIIYVMTILFMAAGSIYVVIIVFIQETFKTVTKDLGYLAVALGVGLFLGSMAYAKWGKKVSRFQSIFFCLILGGIMMAIFAFVVATSQNRWVGMALAGILGIVVGPIVIASNTIVHYVCSAQMRGKVFASLEFVMHLAFLVAMFVSSFLSRHVARMWILIGIGIVFCIVGLLGLFKYKDDKDVNQQPAA
ncbi:MAG: MFS transporter [Candidatus Omnitrophica bacterium]|nr:MFS transporter [Candidatus Omnitrophota bacterium]